MDTGTERHRGESPCDGGGRNQSNWSTHQAGPGMRANVRSWMRTGKDSPESLPRKQGPADTLISDV